MKINTYSKDGLNFIEVFNGPHLRVVLSDLGASIFKIYYDNDELTRNVLNYKDYYHPNIYYGKTIGRVSNRIKGHEIVIDGKKYNIQNNEKDNILHGGKNGLSNQIFTSNIIQNYEKVEVLFTFRSLEVEGDFPGNVDFEVRYVFKDDTDNFDVYYKANTDKKTPISLTNHTYFTLGDRTIENLFFQVDSKYYLDADPKDLIAREKRGITKTLDFRIPKRLIEDINSKSINQYRLKGYDHYLYFDNERKCTLFNKKYRLDITTDFPGVQIYTSNYKEKELLWPTTYDIRDSVAIEPSDPFDELHMLEPNSTYERHINYRFSIMKKEELKEKLNSLFKDYYGELPEKYFSCGGRFEILGNHTDHNHGLCLASSCDLAISAGVKKTKGLTIRFKSEGFEEDIVDIHELIPSEKEYATSKGLIKGVAYYLVKNGYKVGAFDAFSVSTVFKGAGVSSSAAFELLVGQIFNDLYNEGKVPLLDLCKAGKFAENEFFGKKSGLLDQIGVGYGGVVGIDFSNIDNPQVKRIKFPFDDLHFVLINTGGDHSSLSDLYSQIPLDMHNAAKATGNNFLMETNIKEVEEVEDKLTQMEYNRAVHFFSENERVKKAIKALELKNKKMFLDAINESRVSSTNNLRNMMVENQYAGSPLEACDLFLKASEGKGAIKINGGGFAGSVIAVIETPYLDKVIRIMREKYGYNNVKEIFIRNEGPKAF